MRFRRTTFGLILLFSVCTLFAPSSRAQSLPDDFAIETIVSWSGAPFDPMAFALLPDGRVLLTERVSGNVRIAIPGTSTTTVIANIANVDASGNEEGLLGIAIDPNWPTRPYLYFFYSHVGSSQYITMYTASGDLTDGASTNLSLGSPFHLLTDMPNNADHHNGGTLRFGPDGMLYVSLGDDGAGCFAQDPSILAGAILRLDVSGMPGAGTGPPPKADITPVNGNPLTGPGENERLMWAWGLRNPFRFNIDPVTNDVVIGDVGLENYEEIDIVPHAMPGGNYGWPRREGPIDPMCCPPCSSGTFTEPIYAYAHNPESAQSVIGGPIYRTSFGGVYNYPSEYDGDIFLIEFYEGFMRRLERNGSTWQLAAPLAGQPSADNFGTGFQFVSDFQLGNDGALYYLTFIAGLERCICRIVSTVPTGTNDVTTRTRLTTWVAPNPTVAARGVQIHYDMPVAGAGRVRLYDLRGRLVRTLVEHRHLPQSGTQVWDGRADDGTRAVAGTYFYRFEGPTGKSVAGKITLRP